MGDTAADLDQRVLEALSIWEESAGGHDELSIEDLTERLKLAPNDAHRVARSVKRLVDGGQIQALNVTAFGSPYPEYLITGLSSIGIQAARAIDKSRRPTVEAQPPEPTFLGVRRLDIRKDSRQVFV